MPNLTIPEAEMIVKDTIRFGLRHKDYSRCTEIAKKCYLFVTGEGQDKEYLMTLRDKETDREKEIRVKVTKPMTPFAINPIRTQYDKIFRVDGVTAEVAHQDNAALQVINNAIDKYNSDANLSQYLERRYLHFNFMDPNGWHITERRNVPGENGRLANVVTYPLEVSAEQAVNYSFDNGVPVWLIVEQKRTEIVRSEALAGKETAKEQEVSDFFFYAAGVALEYREYVETMPVMDGVVVEIEQPDKKEPRRFVYRSFETGSTEFPGNKWGAYDDPEGDGTVKVPPFWSARFILEDLIETKSVFDVSKHNHVFPKLFHYDQPCRHKTTHGSECQGGYLDGDKSKVCPSCGGTGGKLHFSESDIVTFEIPENLEDFSKLPKLSDLAYYHEPPIAVTQFLFDRLLDFRQWTYLATFNTASGEKPVVEKTAYEAEKLWDEVNTRVYPCAVWMSRLYEKTVRVTAQYQGKAVDLTVKHSFPRDMKLEPLDVLIARFERAKLAGLSYDVTWSIHCAILGKTYLDSPLMVENIKAWEYWRPFKSMEQDLVLLILQSRANDDFDKLLYENWDRVKQLVEAELNGKATFAELPKEAQYKRIQSAVNVVKDNILLLEASEPMFPDLTAGEEGEEDSEEMAADKGGGKAAANGLK